MRTVRLATRWGAISGPALEATWLPNRERLFVSQMDSQFRQRLAALEASLIERTRRLVALEATVEERSVRLQALEQASTEKHQRIMSLEASLAERDQRLKSLEATLSERNQRLATLEANRRNWVTGRIRAWLGQRANS